MQDCGAAGTVQRARTIGKREQGNRRGEGKACPGRKTSRVAGPHEAQGKGHLAAGRTG